ncbi:MAG: dihydrofolate reductase family protein, partial [Actinomycetota bacterium]
APGAPDEDTDGGFAHGGWHLPLFDDLAARWLIDSYEGLGGFLLGRRTYEILGGYWPTAPEDQRAFGDPLNTLPKYVASTTLEEPLAWQNSMLLRGEVPGAVRDLKNQDGGDLQVIGSAQLVQTLSDHDLVDEYRFMIDPLILGGGKRLFPDDGARRPLRLDSSEVTTSGAILATHAPAEG